MNNLTNQSAENVATGGRVVQPAGVAQAQAVLSKWFQALQLTRADTRRLRFTGRGGSAGIAVRLEVLHPAIATAARQRELFYLEAYAAAKLSHFNIARTSKPQELGGIHFRVTEYKPEARTLRDTLSRNGWLALDKACDIADRISSALGCAHALGVLHLQLSPDCVWVEPNGRVTVAGFGVEAAPQLTWAHGERGRHLPATYASVEQASGQVCAAASDLYSLGAILYEMLTDRVPFDSDDEDYVRERQSQSQPAPPHLISLDVPEAVSGVVMKLLEREPRSRFNSAAEFQVALDQARHGKTEPVQEGVDVP
ncbi:MAG TPA: serine/threonine-protein kinase [Blastocatellia bacterium]|nr:serine/threonine-protein kinase [Blastocatellia bacterium]